MGYTHQEFNYKLNVQQFGNIDDGAAFEVAKVLHKTAHLPTLSDKEVGGGTHPTPEVVAVDIRRGPRICACAKYPLP